MADVKMVNLTIEGRPVAVPDGMSVLEAAKTAGVRDHGDGRAGGARAFAEGARSA